jgi:integrase/recombinase XerD
MTLASTFSEWLGELLLWMQRRGYSPLTIRCYGNGLRHFISWTRERPELSCPGEVTSEVLEQYQLHLMTRPSLSSLSSRPARLSASTCNLNLAELKTFFAFLKRSGKLLSNPCAELFRAKEPKRLPRNILTVAEMVRLLSAILTNSPQGLRDRALVELLYGTGIRQIELLRCNLEDLRLGEGFLHVLGKGDKERVVPLGVACQRAMAAYLEGGRPLLLSERTRTLFVSAYHGGPAGSLELTRALKTHGRAAGLAQSMGFHLFRHTCATHLLQGGADLRLIQALLGHANLNTTMIYTRVELSHLKRVLRESHPRELDFEEHGIA